MPGLNLQELKEETFDLKMPDGEELKLLKPTQGMVRKLFQLSTLAKREDVEGALSSIVSFIASALSRNTINKAYTEEQVQELLTFDMIGAILNAYSEWAFGLINQKN